MTSGLTGSATPIEVLEQLTFLLFIKGLDEAQIRPPLRRTRVPEWRFLMVDGDAISVDDLFDEWSRPWFPATSGLEDKLTKDPDLKARFLREAEQLGRDQMPAATVRVGLDNQRHLTKIVDFVHEAAQPAELMAVECMHGLPIPTCGMCKDASEYAAFVYITGGGSVFHLTTMCEGLQAGQRRVARRGGSTSSPCRVATGETRLQGCQPCQFCWPVQRTLRAAVPAPFNRYAGERAARPRTALLPAAFHGALTSENS